MKPRTSLFRRYLTAFAVLSGGLLFAAGTAGLFFSYQESRSALLVLQHAKAQAAASRTEQRVGEIVRQIQLTAPLKEGEDALAQRRQEVRLLRQLPAVTDILLLDPEGKEQLRISRHGEDVAGLHTDYAHNAAFQEARSGKPYFSPVYFRGGAQPLMTVAAAVGPEAAGITVVEVSLQFLQDEIAHMAPATAYVVDARGQLIAHADAASAKRQTDLSSLPQVRAALASVQVSDGVDWQERPVLASYAEVAPLGWRILVEQPRSDVLAALSPAVRKIGWLLLAGLVLSGMASVALARRLARPVCLLQQAAARVAAGEVSEPIAVHTGDELQVLAESVNRVAARMQEAEAGLLRAQDERDGAILIARQQAEKERRSLVDMIDALPLSVFELHETPEGEFSFAFVSENVRALLGVSAAEIMADRLACWRTTLPEDRAVIDPVLQRAHAARQVADFHRRVQFGGHIRWIRTYLAPRRREDGTWVWNGFWIDQTQTRKREEDLRAAKDETEATARARSAFLSEVSQDIRAPLNAIIGLSHLALKDELPPPQRDCLDKIHQAGTALFSLINDILDFAKIDAGKFTLETASFTSDHLLENLAAATMPAAAAKGVALTVDILPNMPRSLVGDPLRLAQILTSLVDHALTFAADGEILVRTERVYSTDTHVMLKFSVRGNGAWAAQFEQMFAPLTSPHASAVHKQGSKELRLHLCKRLVELMGGSIALDSKPGAIGFTCRLGLGIEQDKEQEKEPAPAGGSSVTPIAPLPPLQATGRGARPLSKDTFQQLVGYLSSGDRMALDCFAAHRNELLPALQPHAVQVEQAIKRFDFDSALSLLDHAMTRLDIAFER